MAAQEDQDSLAIVDSVAQQDDEFQSTIEETQESVRASDAEVGKNSFASSNDKIDACVLEFGPSWCDGKVEGFSREGQNMVEGALLAKNRDVGIVSNVEGTRQAYDSEKLELQKGTVNGDGMDESCFLEQRMDRSGLQECRVLHEKTAAERSSIHMVNEDSVSENALEVKKKLLLEELETVLRPEGDVAAEKLAGVKLMQEDFTIPQEDFTIPRSLGIEVIDDTALIETVPAPAIGRKMDVLGNKKSTGKGAIKEIDAKNGKRSRRKAKGAKNVLGMNGKTKGVTRAEDAQNPSGDRKDGAKRKYTRKQIEALRFVNMAAQRMLWKAIYSGLNYAVANEYDNLVSNEHQKNIRLNYDSQQCLAKKKEAPAIISEYYRIIQICNVLCFIVSSFI